MKTLNTQTSYNLRTKSTYEPMVTLRLLCEDKTAFNDPSQTFT